MSLQKEPGRIVEDYMLLCSSNDRVRAIFEVLISQNYYRTVKCNSTDKIPDHCLCCPHPTIMVFIYKDSDTKRYHKCQFYSILLPNIKYKQIYPFIQEIN